MENYINCVGAVKIPKFMFDGKKFYIDYQGAIRAAKLQQVELISRRFYKRNGETEWSVGKRTLLRIANCKEPVLFDGDPATACDNNRLYETLEDFHQGNRASWRVYYQYDTEDIYKEAFSGKAEMFGEKTYRKWFRIWCYDGVKAVPYSIGLDNGFKILFHSNGKITLDKPLGLRGVYYITKEECEAANTPKIIDFEDETEEENPKKKDVFVFGANISVSDSEIDEIKSFLNKFKK